MISEDAFPVEPWHLRETRLDLELLAQSESLFALSNGHIGLRGNLDEGEPYGLPGTYLGVVLRGPPAAVRRGGLRLSGGRADADRRHQRQGHAAARRRRAVRRPVRRGPRPRAGAGPARRARSCGGALALPGGHEVKVTSTRLVSFAHRGVAALEYIVEAVGQFTRVTVQSELVANEDVPVSSGDPRVSAGLDQPLEAVQHEHAERSALLLHRTRSSGLLMAAGDGPRGGRPRPGRGRDRCHGRLGPHHRDLRAAARPAPAHREVPVLRLVRPALAPRAP